MSSKMVFTGFDGEAFTIEETKVFSSSVGMKKALASGGITYAANYSRKRIKIVHIKDGLLFEYSGPEKSGRQMLAGYPVREKK